MGEDGENTQFEMLVSAQTRYIEGLVCKLVEQVHVKKGLPLFY